MAAHLDAVLALVAAPGDDPVVGVGHAAEHVGAADLPPTVVATASASGPGSERRRRPGLGEQMQQAEFCEHVVVPGGRRSDEPGEAPDAVGEAAGLGIDEARGEVVPGAVPGERRVGEPGPHPVVEPPIEFGQSGEHPLDPLVTGRVALVVGWVEWPRVRRRPSPKRSVAAAGVVPGGRPCRVALSSADCCVRRMLPRSAGRATLDPRLDLSRRAPRSAPGHVPTSAASASACLHGTFRLGHVHRNPTPTWSTAVSYGSAPLPWNDPQTTRSSAPASTQRVGVASGCAAVIAAGDGATASTCSTDHTISVDATGHGGCPNTLDRSGRMTEWRCGS